MKSRLGFVGIIIENRDRSATVVNEILSRHGEIILARTGLPRVRPDVSVITLVVEATTDQVGTLTGSLGRVPGVTVKSGLAKG